MSSGVSQAASRNRNLQVGRKSKLLGVSLQLVLPTFRGAIGKFHQGSKITFERLLASTTARFSAGSSQGYAGTLSASQKDLTGNSIWGKCPISLWKVREAFLFLP